MKDIPKRNNTFFFHEQEMMQLVDTKLLRILYALHKHTSSDHLANKNLNPPNRKCFHSRYSLSFVQSFHRTTVFLNIFIGNLYSNLYILTFSKYFAFIKIIKIIIIYQ